MDRVYSQTNSQHSRSTTPLVVLHISNLVLFWDQGQHLPLVSRLHCCFFSRSPERVASRWPGLFLSWALPAWPAAPHWVTLSGSLAPEVSARRRRFGWCFAARAVALWRSADSPETARLPDLLKSMLLRKLM